MRSGAHRSPEGQGRNGVTITDRGGYGFGPSRLLWVIWQKYHNFITIICHSFMLDFLCCKLSEHCSSTNFPIIKTKPFKVTQYKTVWRIFRPKWVKIQIVLIILSLLLKNESKDTHYKYT